MWSFSDLPAHFRDVSIHSGFYTVFFPVPLYWVFFSLHNSNSHLTHSSTPGSNGAFPLSSFKAEHEGTEAQLLTVTQQRFFRVKRLRSLQMVSMS